MQWAKIWSSKIEPQRKRPFFKAHSYRRAFFQIFPKFGNNGKYVSIYGGVLSLFVRFSKRSRNIKFVNIPIFGKKKQENREDWKIARQKCRKFEKKSSPIRITLFYISGGVFFFFFFQLFLFQVLAPRLRWGGTIDSFS